VEAKALGEDGKLRDVFLAGTYTPLRDARGHIDGVLAFAYEVTELVAARRTQEFLAEAGRTLASSLDYRTTLERAVALAVPRLADWCFVDVVENGSPMRFGDDAPADAPRIRV